MTSTELELGIRAEVRLYRDGGRWKMVLHSAIWVEQDIRKELNSGRAFVIDPDSERTNGIPFVQVERGD